MSIQLPKQDENSITSEWNADNRSFIIHVKGDFTSEISAKFRQSYNNLTVLPKKYIVDFKETSYLDSTALGMILELREHAHNRQASIHVTNMNDVILEIFRVLNFHKLLRPEYARECYEKDWV